MSEASKPPGSIGCIDLTVPEAPRIRDFYRDVLGWEASPVDMDGYQDWCVAPPGAEPVGGICHARGGNAGLPPVWLVYFTVAELDQSLAACRAGGGEVLAGPRAVGAARYAVIRDPAGAACALYQPG